MTVLIIITVVLGLCAFAMKCREDVRNLEDRERDPSAPTSYAMTYWFYFLFGIAAIVLMWATTGSASAYHHPTHMVFSFDYPRWCMPDMGKRYGFARKPQCVNGAVAGIVRPVY